MPFQWEPYQPQSGTIAELILRQGQIASEAQRRRADIEANRALQTGQIWSNAVGTIGQIASGAVQQYGQQKQAKQHQQAVSAAVSAVVNGKAGPDAILSAAGPEEGAKILGGLDAYQKLATGRTADARTDAGRLAAGLKALPQEQRVQLWPRALEAAKRGGLPVEGNEQPSDQFLDAVIGWSTGKVPDQPKAPGTREIRVRNADGSESIQIVPDTPGQTFRSEPEPPKEQKPASALEYEYAVKNGYKGTFQQYQNEDANRRRPIVNVHGSSSMSDMETNARQIMDGKMLPGELSKRDPNYNGTLALAARLYRQETGKPLDVNKLRIQQRAAERWVTTQNGQQAQRFYALADSVVNTIDEVRTLADELKQGGVQLWNKAKRDTLLKVYGNTPYSDLAVRYMGALNTLKEEFANLANGGFAPTEDAWKLAHSQINGDFGVRDLNASLVEVQRLINFRIRAFETVPIRTPYGNESPPAAGEGVPDLVRSALGSVGAGRHTLSDGSKWDKLPDGTIRRVQ